MFAGVDEFMRNQPVKRVAGVMLKPGPARAQAEAVTPVIHIAEHAVAPEAIDLVGKQNLQVTNRIFFGFIAARISIELLATRRVQANIVAGFVQDRMQWRIVAGIQVVCL